MSLVKKNAKKLKFNMSRVISGTAGKLSFKIRVPLYNSPWKILQQLEEAASC